MATAIAGLALMLTAACSSGGSSSSAGNSASPAAGKKITVALINGVLSGQQSACAMSGAMKTLTDKGDKYVSMTSNYSVENEMQNVNAAISEHVDLIFLWSGFPQSAAAEVRAAKAAGIPIFLFWTSADNMQSDILGGAYYDFSGSGAMVGDWVVKNVPSGRVMQLTGSLGSGTVEAVKQGFANAIAGSAVKVVVDQDAKWSADTAASLASTLLPAHPDVNVIFTYNDEMALAVQRVVDHQGLTKKIKVVTESVSSDQGIAAVKNGTIPLAAYDPLADYGSEGITDALNLLDKKTDNTTFQFGPSHVTAGGTPHYCYQQYTK